DEKTVPGVQAFALFQRSQAILQHILDIKRPQRRWDEHPVVKPSQRLNIHSVEILDGRMVTTESLLRPICPVKSAGFKFLEVEIECARHGSCVKPSISRDLGNSKCRETRQRGVVQAWSTFAAIPSRFPFSFGIEYGRR